MPDTLSADDARHWALLTRAAFAARRVEIDGLNVFPVPDGDTGTNLYLTFDSALEETTAQHARAGGVHRATLVEECRTLRRAVLLSARGNSGVIVSQLVGGICDVVIEEGLEEMTAADLATAFERGAAQARRCVAKPQEGTILTVADAAAAGARRSADRGEPVSVVAAAAAAAAREALARTPEQLPALAAAGVVDAGGAGCVLMLESLHRVLTGSWTPDGGALLLGGGPARPRGEWHPNRPIDTHPTDAGHALGGDGPAYEVMFLLEDTTAEAVDLLTRTLGGLGDSLIVVGGPDLWNVHVHVDDPGAAVEAGVEAGRPHRIRITHFATQIGEPLEPSGVGVVACSVGPGVTELMTAAGAVVVPSAPGRRASAGALLQAVRATGAAAVIVIPGDKDTLLAAEAAVQAASEEGIVAHVVPARTTVQGLAALAVLDPDASVHANVVAMTSAAVATRHGAVTVAVREALTWAGVCQPGDILGIVDGDIAFLGSGLLDAATEVLGRLLGGGGELVTLVVGEDVEDAVLADAVEAWLHSTRPDLEVLRIEGGQAIYPLLIGVE